jgi:hypothetical protein
METQDIWGIYVDDLIITRSTEAEINCYKQKMKVRFKMSKLGLFSFYLSQ